MQTRCLVLIMCLLCLAIISCDIEKPPKPDQKGTKVGQPDKPSKPPVKPVRVAKDPLYIPVEVQVLGIAQQQITPDKLVVKETKTSKEQALPKQGLAPGKYVLQVEKQGYEVATKEITIDDNKPNVSLKVELTPTQRTVTFKPSVILDELKVNGNVWEKTQGKLLPGKYAVTAKKAGYKTLTKQIEVSMDSDAAIPLKLEPQSQKVTARKVKIVLVYDVVPPKQLEPAKISLHQKDKVFSGSEHTVAPGEYSLKIEQPGYQIVSEKMTVDANPEDYVHKANMQATPRAFHATVNAQVLGTLQIIKPDKIYLNEKQVKIGDQVAPGNYTLKVAKEGYQDFSDQIWISAGADKFMTVVNMKPALRRVQLTFVDAKTAKEIQPAVKLNDRNYEPGISMLPGIYNLHASLENYQDLSTEVKISAGRDAYKQKFSLAASQKGRKVELEVKSASGVAPNAIKATINGKPLEKDTIVPYGKHLLVIEAPHHVTLKKEFVIPEGKEKYVIREELQPTPIKLNFRLSADYPLGQSIEPDKILIDKEPFTGNITAGSHEIEIYKDGYETVREHFLVQPGQTSHLFLRLIKVVQRKVRIQFVDKTNKQNIIPKTVKINDEFKQIENPLELKPGKYTLTATAEGYQDFSQSIEIAPGSKLLELQFELQAITPEKTEPAPEKIEPAPEKTEPAPEKTEPAPEKTEPAPEKTEPAPEKTKKIRPLILQSIDTEANKLLKAKRILLNGEPWTATTPLIVGEKVRLRVEYSNYKTYEEDFVVEDSGDPYRVVIEAEALTSCTFSSIRNEDELDGIVYPYTFFIDGKEIEDHLLTTRQDGPKYYFDLAIAKSVEQIQIRCGYYYIEKSVGQTVQPLGYLSQINGFELVKHLQAVEEKFGKKRMLRALEAAMRKYSRLKQMEDSEKDRLMEYVSQQDFGNRQQQSRLIKILSKIERLFE